MAFRNKNLSPDDERILHNQLEVEYRYILEKKRETAQSQAFKHILSPKQVIDMYTVDCIQSAIQCIQEIQESMSKCADYLFQPPIDDRTNLIYVSKVVVFPPYEQCRVSPEYTSRAYIKKAAIGKDDPFTFTDWKINPLLVTGTVYLIGAEIHAVQLQLCGESYQYTNKAFIDYTQHITIPLPQIQSIREGIVSLHHFLQSHPIKNDIQTCSDILRKCYHSLHQLHTTFSKPRFTDLYPLDSNKHSYMRFSTENGKLIIQIVHLKECSKRSPNCVSYQNRFYTIQDIMTREMNIEFFESVIFTIQHLLTVCHPLLQHCSTLERCT